MKVGVRKPSIKRSIKAQTTGKVKRSVKKIVNPLYGKKGVGYINDPQKAIYSKVYNKTTIGVRDVVGTNKKSKNTTKTQPAGVYPYSAKTYKGCGIILIVIACIFAFVGLLVLPAGLLFIGLGVLLFCVGRKYTRLSKYINNNQEDNEADDN